MFDSNRLTPVVMIYSTLALYLAYIGLLMVSINEVVNPVCILFLSVGLILLQCQATAAECRGNAAALLWLRVR